MIENTEKILLGTILSIPEYQELIISDVNIELFTNRINKLILGCILNLYRNGNKIDILTVVNAFSKLELEEIGGAYYISTLTSNIASGLHYDEHIRILKENYIRTRLITLFHQEINRLSERTHDIQETNVNVTSTIQDLFNITSNEMTNVFDIISTRLDVYSEAKKGELIGLSTGHSKLNKITNGWQPGDLIILAARPSMGKTAISISFAMHAALQGKTILYFSLEMPKERIVDRIISLESNINSQYLQSGKIEDYQWEQLEINTLKYKNTNFLINDESGLTIEGIRAACLKEMSKHKIDLIIIDYLQLVNHSGGGNSTNDKVGHISKNAKGLAKKCECPVIALAQLNRAVEQRAGDKRPGLSDLRDSGNIEQDADMVIFLNRPEFYGITEDGNGNSLINVIEIDIKKNRNGAIGSTSNYKSNDWSYIGEIPLEELNSLTDSMPYNAFEGIEPQF